MKRLLLFVVLFVFGLIAACGISFFTNKANYTTWLVQCTAKDSAGIAWAKFDWAADSFGNKYIQRTAMLVPLKIEGLPYSYHFQFDLGAGLTEIYEKNLQSLFIKAPAFKNKIGRLKGPLQFWNSRLSLNDVTLRMGNITATNQHCYLHRSYGQTFSLDALSDSSILQLGTIGADLFQNKVLIIDYPGKRFAICDTVPSFFHAKFVDVDLDESGRVILPMQFSGKRYRVLFDNGSSIFPLITPADYINQFASGPDTDTLRISSWGHPHNVTGKQITGTIDLAGQKFSAVKIYANHSGYGIDKRTDAIAGNALFWNNVVIIDFKNKKFGVK